MKIIGLTGPAAAGKGTIVEYLVKMCGFRHYSVSGYLTEQIKQAGLEVNRDTMRYMANHLRSEYGSSYIVEQLFAQAQANGQDAIIESIRALGEVQKLKENSDFLLLSIDADQKTRYERALLRKSEKDHISWEEFLEQERLEAENEDPSKQNILACQKLADIQLSNNGTEHDLYQELEKLFPVSITAQCKHILEQVDQYLKLFPAEEQRLTHLKNQLLNGENLWTRKNFNGHLTASAYVLRGDELLMIYHVHLHGWLAPGGHWETGDNELLDTAKREVLERTGISQIRLADWHLEHQLLPIDIDTHPIPENPQKQEDAHVHHDFRYVFFLDQEQDVELQLDEVSSAEGKKISEINPENGNSGLAKVKEKIQHFILDNSQEC